MKTILFSLLITSIFFAGCVSKKNISTTQIKNNSSKKLFEDKENWKPINKDSIIKNKVVQ